MSSYDKFAKQYSDSHGEEGDYFHQTQIDPYILKVVGDPKGKVVYDLGCGNGYISRKLAKSGAKVFASDISGELVNLAKEKSEGLDINYSVHDAIDFTEYENEQFDVVIMNMVIHYIEDLDTLFKEISRVLKPNGMLAFSTSHFFRPDHPYSEWIKGKIGESEKLFIKVTNYLETYSIKTKSLWDNETELTIINRPLNKIVNTMSKHNLLLKEVHEPESVGFAKSFSEELQKTHHIPTFIIFGAIKV